MSTIRLEQAPSVRPRRLLDQVRDAMRVRHYSYRTEQAYRPLALGGSRTAW